jgi:hypothetical protein
MWQIQNRREMYTGLQWGKLKQSNHLKNLGIDERIILNGALKNRI